MDPINVITFPQALPDSRIRVRKVSVSFLDKDRLHDHEPTMTFKVGLVKQVITKALRNNNARNLFIFNYSPTPLQKQNLTTEGLIEDFITKAQDAKSKLQEIIWPNRGARKNLPFVGFVATIPEFLKDRIVELAKQKRVTKRATRELPFRGNRILLRRSTLATANIPVIVDGFREGEGQRRFAKLLTWFDSVAHTIITPNVDKSRRKLPHSLVSGTK